MVNVVGWISILKPVRDPGSRISGGVQTEIFSDTERSWVAIFITYTLSPPISRAIMRAGGVCCQDAPY